MRDRQACLEDNCHKRDFAVVLAAGYSTRMGVCKTTLPWRNNQTLLRYQTEQFLQAKITPIVVLGSHNAHRQRDCPTGSQVVINKHCDRGKTSSILTGLQSLPRDFTSVVISAVDFPRSSEIYRTLLRAYHQSGALIIAPTYREKMGHPLLFSSQMLPELKNISEASLGLRRVVNKFYAEIEKIEFITSEVLINLNTPVVYQLELEKTN